MKNNLKDIDILSFFAVGMFGVWGAFMNYAKRLNADVKLTTGQKIFLFVNDLASATGISMLTFLILQGYGLNEPISVGLAGLAGHQGTQLIYYIQIVVFEKLGAKEALDEVKKGGKDD